MASSGAAWRVRDLAQARRFVGCLLLQHQRCAAQGAEEHAQWETVQAFKTELSAKGIIGEYNDAEMFMSTVLPQLLQILGILIGEERRVQSALSYLPTRPAWSIAGQPVPIGKRVAVIKIGERDACYHRRDEYIGRTGSVLEAQRVGDWLRGTFRFDVPLFDGDDGRYAFLQFQIAEMDGEREHEIGPV